MFRFLILAVIALLYFVPLYRTHISSQEKAWGEGEIYRWEKPRFRPEKSPFYKEGFVNEADPGVISHVSSICPVDNDKMICTWYAGSMEGARDVAIYSSSYDEGEGTWTPPSLLIDRKKSSLELHRYVKKVGNSLVFNDDNGGLMLFYASITMGGWSGSSLNYKVSADGGRTWSPSRKMVLSPFFNLTNNLKNKGIRFQDGSFLLPVYHEFMNNYSELIRIRRKDSSFSYEIRKMTRGMDAIQPSIVYGEGKKLTAFFRNMDTGEKNYILTAHSEDLGQSWSGLTKTSLPNPNSGFDMFNLDDTTYMGIINDSFTDRSKLTMIISHDGGKTWKAVKTLENSAGKEFAYPFISRSNRGLFHITYTYDRRRIKHIVFNEPWLKKLEGSHDTKVF